MPHAAGPAACPGPSFSWSSIRSTPKRQVTHHNLRWLGRPSSAGAILAPQTDWTTAMRNYFQRMFRQRPKTVSFRSRVKRRPPLLLERLEQRTVPALLMQLEQVGFAPLVVQDNDAHDSDPAVGSVAYFGSYGN